MILLCVLYKTETGGNKLGLSENSDILKIICFHCVNIKLLILFLGTDNIGCQGALK